MNTVTPERESYETMLAKLRERFDRQTTEHEMTVLRDDGLYRHLRFQAPPQRCEEER